MSAVAATARAASALANRLDLMTYPFAPRTLFVSLVFGPASSLGQRATIWLEVLAVVSFERLLLEEPVRVDDAFRFGKQGGRLHLEG